MLAYNNSSEIFLGRPAIHGQPPSQYWTAFQFLLSLRHHPTPKYKPHIHITLQSKACLYTKISLQPNIGYSSYCFAIINHPVIQSLSTPQYFKSNTKFMPVISPCLLTYQNQPATQHWLHLILFCNYKSPCNPIFVYTTIFQKQ